MGVLVLFKEKPTEHLHQSFLVKATDSDISAGTMMVSAGAFAI